MIRMVTIPLSIGVPDTAPSNRAAGPGNIPEFPRSRGGCRVSITLASVPICVRLNSRLSLPRSPFQGRHEAGRRGARPRPFATGALVMASALLAEGDGSVIVPLFFRG